MTAPSRYLSCFFLDVSGELPQFQPSTIHLLPMEHPSFLCSHIQTLTSSLNLKFKHGQPGVFIMFFVVHLRSRQTTLHQHARFWKPGFSFTGVSFNTTQDRAIEQQLSGRIILGVPHPQLWFLSHCVAHSCVSFFFSLCFSTYSPQYCATLSYYFLAVGFNNELQFAWLGISFPCWITCLQILSPMGFRLHHCSSRFRILRRAHMSRRALLTWGSTHGESRLGGVACRDVRLYPRIGDDSRIWWIFLGLGSTDVLTSGSIILLYVYSLCCIFYSLECSGGLVIIFFGPWTDILDLDCHSIFSLNSMFDLDSKSTAMW